MRKGGSARVECNATRGRHAFSYLLNKSYILAFAALTLVDVHLLAMLCLCELQSDIEIAERLGEIAQTS